MDLEKVGNSIKENIPKIVKENKGALIGAALGYFLTDNEQAKTMILTAIAGALVVDKKVQNKEEE
jgi:hypothetical protein